MANGTSGGMMPDLSKIGEGRKIIPVEHVDEVLRLALTQPLESIDWTEADELAAQPPAGVAPAGELPH